MALYAIADLHFGKGINKTMDLFGEPWINHMDKLIENWQDTITDRDTVLVPGDICWGKNLNEAKADLDLLSSLKGKKVLLEGNHDFWWQSQNKVTSAYPEMFFLKNNFYLYGNTAICGTRGWTCPNDSKFKEDDERIYLRECARLKISLDSAVKMGYGDSIIVMTHYPPMNDKHETSGFIKLIENYSGIKEVLYGHLHGKESIDGRFEGILNGIKYSLVSADYLDFRPAEILNY
ncbi:3',5'-cyclic adenosine monophosphate phosphodiesterase CpdA [Clostridiales bacterium]|nr:3',5'-cyclic adenosine monophosphate phosphodiesterase CpdA [Clostridiales bacterium]